MRKLRKWIDSSLGNFFLPKEKQTASFSTCTGETTNAYLKINHNKCIMYMQQKQNSSSK
jgi:hypothetical protein